MLFILSVVTKSVQYWRQLVAGCRKAGALIPDVGVYQRADVVLKGPGWPQIVLAVAHQDVNLYAFVWSPRGSNEKCMIHAATPGWRSEGQRTIGTLVACSGLNQAASGSHRRVLVTHPQTHTCAHRHIKQIGRIHANTHWRCRNTPVTWHNTLMERKTI